MTLGCAIFDLNGALQAKFSGTFCAFAKDGSYFSYNSINQELRHVSNQGKTLWERKLKLHDQLSLSEDGQTLLTIGSEVTKGDICPVRSDVLLLLSAKDGKETNAWHLASNLAELLQREKAFFLVAMKNGTCEHEHIDSFHQNATGQYVANLPKLGSYALFDEHLALTKIAPHPAFQVHAYRDVQLLSDGSILAYLGARSKQEYSLEPRGDGAVLIKMDANVLWSHPGGSADLFPPDNDLGAAVQNLGNEVLVSHSTKGGAVVVWFSKRGEEVKRLELKIPAAGRLREQDLSEFLIHRGRP